MKLSTVTCHAQASEKSIERHLVDRCKAAGIQQIKINTTSASGYPDRLMLLPGGSVVWCELKSTGQKPRALQRLQFRRLKDIGHRVFVCDSRDAVDAMLTEILNSK